jgi:hypothetical protein
MKAVQEGRQESRNERIGSRMSRKSAPLISKGRVYFSLSGDVDLQLGDIVFN